MTTEKKKGSFSELLNELESMDGQMAKAFGDGDGAGGDGDDKKIKAAADGDRDGDGKADGDEKVNGAGDAGDGDGDDEDEEEMAKALGVKPVTIKDEDGKEQQAYDGLQMLKAMWKRVKGLGTGSGDEDMLKALTLVGGTVGKLLKRVQEQDKMLKTMQEQLNAVGNKGAGRKAVLQVLSKSLGAEGEDGKGEMDGQQILAKAQVASSKGLISAIEVAHVERAVNTGAKPAPEVMAKINQA
jgi:hypothetical protein